MTTDLSIIEVTISCPPQTVAALSELLWTLPEVTGVMEEYDDEIVHRLAKDEAAGWITAGNLKWLKVYGQGDLKAAVDTLIHTDESLRDCRVLSGKAIAEEDWAESWKQHWDITRIGDRIVVRPGWLDYAQENPDETVIDLDPGSAFGTGTHETTRLMLSALEELADQRDFSRLSLLDVGTGSGILAIYAARRGCRDIRAIDVDPLSVRSAEANAARNGVTDVIHVSDTPLAELCRTRYDIVIANIIAPVILSLWDEMLLRLESGGTLLLSGLIEKNLPDIRKRLEADNFAAVIEYNDGGWYAVQAVWES